MKYALLAAFLYALSSPISKLLLEFIGPTLMAACLYLGAGLGLLLVKKIKKAREDGVVTKEELDDIVETGKEIANETGSLIEQIKEESDKKSEGE